MTVMIDSRLLNIRKSLPEEICTKDLSDEIFVIDSLLKTNPWTYK